MKKKLFQLAFMELSPIVEPFCISIDRLRTDVKLPGTIEGDILVFPLAGAYTYSASPL